MDWLSVPEVRPERGSPTYGSYIIEPLETGMGITLGNGLRRALLRNLPGAAVTWVRVREGKHEFSSIPHMKEDVMQFLLNVKAIRLRPLSERPGRLFLDVEGQGEVTAADIQPSSDFEIVNPELFLATLDSPEARLSVEFNVEIGTGYLPAEKQNRDNIPIDCLPVDAIFTPIRRVNYAIEPIQVEEGEGEKLVLEVWTDGSKSPEEAISQAAQILIQQFSALKDLAKPIPLPQVKEPSLAEEQYNVPIEELGLKERTKNSLMGGGIRTLGGLLSMSEKELRRYRDFGDKALEDVMEKLKLLGLKLKEDE